MLRKFFTALFLLRLKLPRDVHRYAFQKFSDRIFVQTKDKTLTYGELEDRAYRLVQAFQAAGLRKGDTLFTQVRAERELLEIRVTASEMGLVVCAFHDAHSGAFILHAAKEVSPKLFIVDPDYGIGSYEVVSLVESGLTLWATGKDSRYEQQLSSHQPIRSQADIALSDILALGFTSGTTGQPKGLMSSHGAAIASLKLMVKNIEFNPDRNGKNINLTAIPFVGAGSGLIMPTMLSGSTLVVLDQYTPENLVATVKQFAVTRLFVTPSQLIDILEMPSSVDADLATVNHIVYGTAPMPAAKLEEALMRFGPIFQQGYGQAEVLPPVSLLNSSDHMSNGKLSSRSILSSCGRVVDGVVVRISDSAGNALPEGERGEVHVKTPTRFQSYLNPEQNEGVILADSFFRTGDYGYIDDAGYLHILDRQADLISVDEGVLYPRLVEEETHDHPAVRECCLVAPTDKPVLCISIREAFANSDKTAIKNEILALLSSRLLAWQVPQQVIFVDEMPRSLLGKVLRREVRDKLTENIAAA